MTFVRPGSRIAVTGVTGFVGTTLVRHLVEAGYVVIGISETREPPASISELLAEYHAADLTIKWPQLGPVDGIVHLAGLSAVGPSFDRPQDYITCNSSMVTHALEQALRAGWRGRALIVSSGAVYRHLDSEAELTEDSPLAATSPYVVSKLLVERQAEYYVRRGVDAVVVRPFNHIGPGQRPGFIVPDLVAKLDEWVTSHELTVGNLDSRRDYTDVRDIAVAYRLLLERQTLRHQTYNVCSGNSYAGRQVLDAVCAALGRGVPPLRLEADRAIDPSAITGSSVRLRMETGWKPTIKLQTSIEDYVADRAAAPGAL